VARYHFNIRNGNGFTADDEGTDLSSVEEARLHAIEGARSLISAEVLQGTLDLSGQIEVTDEAKAAVMTVRFADAVEVRPAEPSTGSDR
jgi:hypothetical protein